MRNAATFAKLGILAAAAFSLAATACPGTSGPAGSPQWPAAAKINPQPLPEKSSWPGVYFFNTPGVQGTMHLFAADGNRVRGCFIAQDKHATATFTGEMKDNLVTFDWTERRVGFAGPPSHFTAYAVLVPQTNGRDKIVGKYGQDVSDDGVFDWEGVKQSPEPKEDGCKLDTGDVIETPGKGLQ